jgi:5-methylcytosine-specific restriction endonuclease McrA
MERNRRAKGLAIRPIGRQKITVPNAENVRKATAAYRERYPERYRAAHRLHQLRRLNSIEVSSDGSLDDQTLQEIYATNECYYCEEFTPRHKRTLDHKTPLIRGGHHTKVNACMACSLCNSRKGKLTELEFREKMNDRNIR